jgi:glycerol-3-phosphate acyltransferase PlsY
MLGASLLIILKHKANIKRLLNGTENRFQFHKS